VGYGRIIGAQGGVLVIPLELPLLLPLLDPVLELVLLVTLEPLLLELDPEPLPELLL